jgi:type IV secretion system protein VirD4
MGEKERQSILSSARTQLNFLDSGGMTDVLTGSDFKLSDLKSQKTTLYLCLPANRMGTHSRWLRVIINLALIAFERTRAKTDIPALMVLDEFAVLGHMRSIEVAAGLMAGFGLKLWVVVQDLGQIKRLYKDSWETFIGNAGVVTFWSNSDKFTLDYISDKLGQTNVRIDQPSNATANQRFGGTSGVREETRVQRLAPPHELERLLDRRQQTILVLAAGQPPVVLERIVYFDDSNFVGQFDE